MSILSKLLGKRGIDKVEDLPVEEQEQFRKWEFVLSGKTLTVDLIKDFCKSQIKVIEGKCDGVVGLTQMQQACLHVYLNILKLIEAPEAERESLERYITTLIEAKV